MESTNNVPLISKANNITETVNIQIDVIWNSKKQNLTAVQFANRAKKNSSTDIKFNEVTAMPDDLNKYDNRIWCMPTSIVSSAAQSSATGSSTKPKIYTSSMNSWLSTCSSQTKYWISTGSAVIPSHSSGTWQLNNSLWATGSPRPTTTNVPSLSISGKGPVNKFSNLIIILCFSLGVMLCI